MMRPRLALAGLLLLSGLAACSPPEGERRPLEAFHPGPSPAPIRVRGSEVFYDGRWVKDGRVTFHDRQGNVTHEGDYKLGIESGQWTERGEDGIQGSGLYVEGKRQGSWTYAYPSGEVQSQGEYQAGKRIGTWLRFYSDGSKEAEVPYVDGLMEGVVKVWEATGAPDPEASGTFKAGERVR